jgi:hypothetical protein
MRSPAATGALTDCVMLPRADRVTPAKTSAGERVRGDASTNWSGRSAASADNGTGPYGCTRALARSRRADGTVGPAWVKVQKAGACKIRRWSSDGHGGYGRVARVGNGDAWPERKEWVRWDGK